MLAALAAAVAATAALLLPDMGPSEPTQIVGHWDAAPAAVPTAGTTDGPLFGNGVLAVIFGGRPDGFSYNFGMNSFVREISGGQGVAAAPGGVDIFAPAFTNASFRAEQLIANATVTTTFSKPGVGTLRTSSFVRPIRRGVSLMVTELLYTAAAAGPRAITLGVAARAGPLGAADEFLIWGPCTATSSVLVANRSNGEDWQDIYRGRKPTQASYGKRITRVAIAVSALTASSGNAFVNVSEPDVGMDAGRSANGTLQVTSGHRLTLLVSVVNNRDIAFGDSVAAAVAALETAGSGSLEATVQEARDATLLAWRNYWGRSSISLPHSPLTERFFYSSLYLLKLAAGGGTAPGLYGPFITSDKCMWSGDIHLNYNYQATYYGAIQAGHPELLPGYFKPLLDYRKWARVWAQNLFDCKGFAFPTGIAPFGSPSDAGGWMDNGQRSDGLFAALHFSTSWLFLRNETERALLLDYVGETMDFFLDYLVKHETADGYEYRVLNDCFMEQCGVPDGRGNYVANVQNINTQLSVAYLRFHLHALIDMAAAAPAATPRPPQLAQWHDVLTHLPPLPTTIANMSVSPNCTPARASAKLPSADRCIQCRWLWNGTDDGCAHSLETIYAGVLGAGPSAPGSNPVETSAIFPGSDAVGFASPASDLEVARNTVEYLDSWFQGNAFAQIFGAAGRVFAGHEKARSLRAGEDHVMRTFERVVNGSMKGNMWVREYGGGVETLGSLAYVAEALMQSHEGFVRLFPGLPPGEAASFTGLRARGGFVVNASLDDDGSVRNFRLRSEAGENVTVHSPSGLATVDARTGAAVPVETLPAQLWRFATEVDGVYQVTVPGDE